ncbi:hypothetical protein BJ165DRAFT_439410 [Panaeolus papilionaceus]|nr:hypothetical protein BJ165DRAFT_439410 [Panaeolus papilionaceus]
MMTVTLTQFIINHRDYLPGATKPTNCCNQQRQPLHFDVLTMRVQHYLLLHDADSDGQIDELSSYSPADPFIAPKIFPATPALSSLVSWHDIQTQSCLHASGFWSHLIQDRVVVQAVLSSHRSHLWHGIPGRSLRRSSGSCRTQPQPSLRRFRLNFLGYLQFLQGPFMSAATVRTTP